MKKATYLLWGLMISFLYIWFLTQFDVITIQLLPFGYYENLHWALLIVFLGPFLALLFTGNKRMKRFGVIATVIAVVFFPLYSYSEQLGKYDEYEKYEKEQQEWYHLARNAVLSDLGDSNVATNMSGPWLPKCTSVFVDASGTKGLNWYSFDIHEKKITDKVNQEILSNLIHKHFDFNGTIVSFSPTSDNKLIEVAYNEQGIAKTMNLFIDVECGLFVRNITLDDDRQIVINERLTYTK